MGAGFVGPLDGYTAGLQAAFSPFRRLLTSYSGSLVRVMRSSDSTEMDIGALTNGDLDTTALTAFVGASNGTICKIYDQSGNSRDYGQATGANQMLFVDTGTLLTNEGKPCMFGAKASSTGLVQSAAFEVGCWITTAKLTAAFDYPGLITGSGILMIGAASGIALYPPDLTGYGYFVNGVDQTSGLSPFCYPDTKCLTVTTSAPVTQTYLWGSERNIPGRYFEGYMQEQVLYSSTPAFLSDVETALMTPLGIS